MADITSQIIAALRRHDCAGWRVTRQQVRSTQRYLIGTRTEARRTVERTSYPLAVYHDHAGPDGAPARGSASATVLDDGSNLAQALEQALSMAALVSNPPYSLPRPASYPEVQIADQQILARPDEAADELIAQLIAAVAAEQDVRLSSAELFVEERLIRICNSEGVDVAYTGTSALLELVLLAGTGAQEMESHVLLSRRRLEDLALAEVVRRQAAYARDALQTIQPPTGTQPVLLSGEALVALLAGSEGDGVLQFHTAAQTRYQELSRLQEGLPITGERELRGDRLTVRSSSLLPYGSHSWPADGEGLPGAELTLIEDGVLRRLWAPQRYADYLGLAPTGGVGNLIVDPGHASTAQLLDDTALHIVAFSWMDPDAITGDFVAEIRLGYLRTAAGWQAVRGGSLSGNLFEALADVRLSSETGFFGAYHGPRAARFGALTIAGAE